MSGKVIAIMATNKKLLLGLQCGKLAWRCKEDMEFFKETTMGNVLIMGRKTYESLPSKSLPGRHIVVISRSYLDRQDEDGVSWERNPVEALAKAKALAQERNCDIYIAGGAQIYNLFYRHCDKFLVTLMTSPEPDVPEGEKVRLPNMANGCWNEIVYYSKVLKILTAHAAVCEFFHEPEVCL